MSPSATSGFTKTGPTAGFSSSVTSATVLRKRKHFRLLKIHLHHLERGKIAPSLTQCTHSTSDIIMESSTCRMPWISESNEMPEISDLSLFVWKHICVVRRFPHSGRPRWQVLRNCPPLATQLSSKKQHFPPKSSCQFFIARRA